MLKQHKNFLPGCVLLALGLFVGSAQAELVEASPQASPPASMPELQASGYTLMDDLSTPLLHHVATGAKYDLHILAQGEHVDGFGIPDDVRRKAASKNEFERADVEAVWAGVVAQRVQQLKNSKGYLVALESNWKEYDFGTRRYGVELHMAKHAWRSKSSFHCAGAYSQIGRNEYATACLTATDLNNGAASLQYFTFLDVALARRVKESPGNFRVYAIAQPSGSYQTTKGREISYVPLETFTASGVQPVKISNLMLVERNGGAILAYAQGFSEGAASRAATSSGSSGAVSAPASSVPAARAQVQPQAQAQAPAQLPVPSPGLSNAASATLQAMAPGPKWRRIGGAAPVFYSDMDSVRRVGDVVVVRELADFSGPQAGAYQSVVRTLAYHCAKRTVRQMSVKSYSDRHAAGAVVSDDANPIDLAPFKPNTVGEASFNFACNAVAAQ